MSRKAAQDLRREDGLSPVELRKTRANAADHPAPTEPRFFHAGRSRKAAHIRGCAGGLLPVKQHMMRANAADHPALLKRDFFMP